ncbi:STAS domain-containing protein [Alkalicoccus daliensis]|uniref:RsbT co-antagonist protein RsbR n=1 Tax=Alkalicoccus daliensis TaxID=745820 RepID=A0A1H0CJ86_9BACI|nr:STAS domain-containing protein [Alkalicoccus daliensis]SDN57945.1 rsbT co-antagonist protein RsbR [Alkalicoccus daliensis]
MSYNEEISIYLRDNKATLAKQVVSQVLQKMKLSISSREREEAVIMYTDFFEFFSFSILNQSEEAVPESMLAWSKQNAERQVTSAESISKIVRRYPPTRDVFSDLLTALSISFTLTLQQHSMLLKKINQLLDASLMETFHSYEQLSEEYRQKQEAELLQLSAPIVPVQQGIVIVPIIGNITPERTRYMMEETVPAIVKMRAEVVIADYSGISEVTPEVIYTFDQIGRILKLMGISVVTTGMRPETVLKVVQSGINVSRGNFYSTVKQALEVLADGK